MAAFILLGTNIGADDGTRILSFGFSGMASWGIWSAADQAPFSILGVSPAPLLFLLGLLGGQILFAWIRTRQAPSVKPESVIDGRITVSALLIVTGRYCRFSFWMSLFSVSCHQRVTVLSFVSPVAYWWHDRNPGSERCCALPLC